MNLVPSLSYSDKSVQKKKKSKLHKHKSSNQEKKDKFSKYIYYTVLSYHSLMFSYLSSCSYNQLRQITFASSIMDVQYLHKKINVLAKIQVFQSKTVPFQEASINLYSLLGGI